jgi:riboflavin kinase / FMN adenylyltransferase
MLVPDTCRNGVVSIGNFDGVHRGHLRLIERLIHLGKELGVPSIAITFDPSPSSILAPDRIGPPLTTIEHRRELLQQAGIDHVLVLKTTQELLSIEADDFFRKILVGQLEARGIAEGPNFHFGHNRVGNVARLKELCSRQGMRCEIVEPDTKGDEWISSSRIRRLIQAGKVAEANEMLISPFRMRGIVSHGAHRGRTIGFPTANLEQIKTLIPAMGVFAARVVAIVRDSQAIERVSNPVALHIGPNPTFGEEARKIEAHVIDANWDLYDSVLDLEILSEIRGVQKFESVEALIRQLQSDVVRAREIASQGVHID